MQLSFTARGKLVMWSLTKKLAQTKKVHAPRREIVLKVQACAMTQQKFSVTMQLAQLLMSTNAVLL
jgi:hypothetical protein